MKLLIAANILAWTIVFFSTIGIASTEPQETSKSSAPSAFSEGAVIESSASEPWTF